MRPYLAILKDSFREALASRVLWIMLTLITLILVALLPISAVEHTSGHLQSGDIRDGLALANQLKAAAASPDESPGKHIWPLLSDGLRASLSATPEKPADGALPAPLAIRLREELDALLARNDFYDARSWSSLPNAAAIEKLYAEPLKDSDADGELRRNRAALQAAFPNEIGPSRASSHSFYYFTPTFSTAPSAWMDVQTATRQVVAGSVDLILGAFAVFAGILVTAPIIPQTFEAGAIDLLFSKPVFRTLVFLTKFLGGCAFIFVCAAYLFSGLCLVLGWRLGVWMPELLWCIPLYLFLFAIYYAVSALAGVVWKNAIVSVVISVLFWTACFGLKVCEPIFQMVADSQRLVGLATDGTQILATNEEGDLLRLEDGAWSEILSTDHPRGDITAMYRQRGLLGPVCDPLNRRFLAIHTARFGGAASLLVSQESNHWRSILGPAVPAGASALLVDREGNVFVVASGGVFRWNGQEADSDMSSKKPAMKLFGLELNWNGLPARAAFEPATENLFLSAPLASINPQNDEIAIHDRDQLIVLQADKAHRYRQRQRLSLPSSEAGPVAYAGDTLAIALTNGQIDYRDPGDLHVLSESKLPDHSAVRFAEISPDGHYLAVLTQDRRLWLYDAKKGEDLSARIRGQGDISAAEFTADRLWVASHTNRLTQYDTETWQTGQQYSPPADAWNLLYRYGVHPLHIVFPKPGELNTMTQYLLVGREAHRINRISDDPRVAQPALDVWGPIVSNSAFVVIVLAAGCWYIHRKDF